MSLGRRILFALITLTLIFGLIEAGAWIAWLQLEARAVHVRTAKGEESVRNNAIKFLLQTDPVIGYVLRPNNPEAGINAAGFTQRDEVPVARTPQVLRIAAMGESTTQGQGPEIGNYPVHLKRLIEHPAIGGRRVEMINAGVSGWVSDQVALWAERKVAAYQPDIVIFYTGWNDFQSYSPFFNVGPISYFEAAFGNPFRIESDFPIKTVVFAVAAYEAMLASMPTTRARSPAAPSAEGYAASAEDNYRYLFASLDRGVAAFRRTNPNVKVAISTMVGRWPEGSRQDYVAANGHIWWMKDRSLDPVQASKAMERFNDAIRRYVRASGLLLIDAERALRDTDRRKLQWDFAHFTDEGYELLANVVYAELVKQQAIQGAPSPRLAELLAKYAKAPAVKQQ